MAVLMDVNEYIINAVRDRPHLYDANYIDFRDFEKRENTFKSIGEPISMSGEEVAKRWKNVRERFGKEKRALEEKKRNGAASDVSSKWKYFESLLFLTDHVKPRTYSNLVAVSILESLLVDPDSHAQDSSAPSPTTSIDADLVEGFHDSQFVDCSLETFDVSQPTKIRKTDPQVDAFTVMKSVGEALTKKIQTRQTMDAETAFGALVTSKLKSLSNKKSSLAQIKIQELLFRLEFEESN